MIKNLVLLAALVIPNVYATFVPSVAYATEQDDGNDNENENENEKEGGSSGGGSVHAPEIDGSYAFLGLSMLGGLMAVMMERSRKN